MSAQSISVYLSELLAKVFCVWFALSSIALEVRADRRSPNPPAVRLTRLRATSPTVIISQTRGGLFATYSNVMVRNVGRVEAKDIRVSILFDLNVTTRLTGPKKLAPNEVGIYSSGKKLPVPQRSRQRVFVGCSNCRR